MSSHITIAAAGDTMCRLREGHDGDPFSSVHDCFEDADVGFVNLETVLTGREKSPVHKLVTVRTDPDKAYHLVDHNINMINVANNHILDYGASGAAETCATLREYGVGVDGVAICGHPCGYSYIGANGVTVRLLGYHEYQLQSGYAEVNYYENQYTEMLKEVSEAAKLHDVVIVSLHWGIEHVVRPSPAQVYLAHLTIDAGAKVVLGHHPHVVQGIEEYNGGLIAYSLGCFNFWMMGYLKDRWYHKLSYILMLSVSRDGVSHWKRVPVWIDDTAKPVPLTGVPQVQWAQQYFKKLDKKIPHRDFAIMADTESPGDWQSWYEEVGWEYVPLIIKSFIKTVLRFGLPRLKKFVWWLRQRHTRLAFKGLFRAIINRRWRGHYKEKPPKEFGWA